MNIIWNPNPLRTTVEIDNADRERILLQIQNDEYIELITYLEYKIENNTVNSLEQVSDALARWSDISDMTVDHIQVKTFESYLQSEHAGDCTCIPCSCMKCYAEYALGISTIPGLGKHEGSSIQGAFGKDNARSIDEAIQHLSEIPDYIKPATWPKSVEYETHIPRWERERINALQWLITHKETHGF